MISRDEIDRTILELEGHDTSFAVCEKLAMLYIVRDHMEKTPVGALKYTEIQGDSDFIRAIRGKDSVKVLECLNELMGTIQVINSRLYDAVISKLYDL